ncbi:hypothetical protein ATL17_1279 [Maritalea mobilis]|uniref:Uncharacterized protein n=1 Tax=Maritalea mobilis TaxID=483324 RepID=A0A4R6VXG1_9HYPH|nr:hypothetical protein [Maritalea mobilis]TDQ67270.1 hypothetical protein ATL17_1279 [Maritalea mobilis]
MKYLPKDFETFDVADGRAKDVLRGLTNEGHQVPLCTPKNCCQLEHCHKCLRRLRRSLVSEAKSLGFHKKDWVSVCLTPNGPPIPIGELGERLNLAREVKKHARRLQRHISDALIVGGLDIALLIVDGEIVGWQPHLHLMLHGISKEESLKALRPAYPRSEFASKPIRHATVDRATFFSALSYTYKSVFFPRGDRRSLPKGKLRGSLPRKYETELRAFLARWPIGSRLMLRNARNYPARDRAKLQVRLIHPFNDCFHKPSSRLMNRKSHKRKNAMRKRVNGGRRTK